MPVMPFPEITPSIPRAEDAPTDIIHIPAGAQNIEDAQKLLAVVATADAQTKLTAAIGQLPTNKNSTLGDDPFIQAGFKMLSEAHALAQFVDRDAPTEMAKAGMEGIQQFLARPDQLDTILERLEQVCGQVCKQGSLRAPCLGAPETLRPRRPLAFGEFPSADPTSARGP